MLREMEQNLATLVMFQRHQLVLHCSIDQEAALYFSSAIYKKCQAKY